MNALSDMSWGERGQLLTLAAAHLNQVLEGLLLALAVGLPVGMLAVRVPRLERIILAVAGLLRSVPGLALLGLVLFVFGGKPSVSTVIATLFVYSLLPIARGTVLGLKSIDPSLLEVSDGLGMTPKQRLLLVEMPLAAPQVLRGIRQAAAGSVGLAALGALLGAQNLGSAILQGIQHSNPGLLLAGSGLAALLALACAGALGTLEQAFDPLRKPRSQVSGWVALGGLVALLAVGVYGGLASTLSRASGPSIALGSKESREEIMIGQMLADLVEAHTNMSVDRRFSLGDSAACYAALKKGEIDGYVEFSATALSKLFKPTSEAQPAEGAEPPAAEAEAEKAIGLKEYRRRQLERLRKACGEDNVVCLDPLGFEKHECLLMRKDVAKRMGVTRISDLRQHEARLRLGLTPEFKSRTEVYQGFLDAYGLEIAVSQLRESESNALYDQLSWRLVDVMVGESTDGRNASLGLQELVDDKHYFPVNEAVPFVRAATLRKYPKLREALGRLAGKLDSTAIQRLNHQVIDVERDPAEVAHEFLEKEGLLKK